jgi:hypothetical protein
VFCFSVCSYDDVGEVVVVVVVVVLVVVFVVVGW